MAELLPAGLETHRADLFAASKQMDYTLEDFLEYWPFLSNVWRANRPTRTKEGYKAMLCYCRCHTDAVRDREKVVGKGLRRRVYYDQDCTAAMRVVWRKDRQRVFLYPKRPHVGHDLDYLDERSSSHAMKCIIRTLMERLDNDRAAVLKHLRTSPFANAFTAARASHVTTDRIRSAALTITDIDDPQCPKGALWGRSLFESPPPSWLKSTEEVSAAAKTVDPRCKSVDSRITTGNASQREPWNTTISSLAEPPLPLAGVSTGVINREPHDHDESYDHDDEPAMKRRRCELADTRSTGAVSSNGSNIKSVAQTSLGLVSTASTRPLSLWWKD